MDDNILLSLFIIIVKLRGIHLALHCVSGAYI